MMDKSLKPDMAIFKVRGIGVAVIVKISTPARSELIFLFSCGDCLFYGGGWGEVVLRLFVLHARVLLFCTGRRIAISK